MKSNVNANKSLASLICIVAMLMTFSATAQRYAVKAYGDIGLGKGLSITTALNDMTSKSSSNAFGVDFGWTFWKKSNNSLEANIGLDYRTVTATFDIASMSYNYAAPAAADVDGNVYQRYTTLSNVQQKINLGYFNIPIYLQYQYRAAKWLGIHADFGFGLGFKCVGSIGSTTGTANSYGVYPEYDDLVIKAGYLNDFGEIPLVSEVKADVSVKGFSASILVGVGLEFYFGGPVSIDLGIRYNEGLTTVFDNQYAISSTSTFTSENAPVTYTVAKGQQVRALSDYLKKAILNRLAFM